MTRRTDQHGRDLYDYGEVPPPDARLAVWRGKVTVGAPPCPSSQVAGHPNGPCLAGWIESGDWWLHCGTCRPWVTCDHEHPGFTRPAPEPSLVLWNEMYEGAVATWIGTCTTVLEQVAAGADLADVVDLIADHLSGRDAVDADSLALVDRAMAVARRPGAPAHAEIVWRHQCGTLNHNMPDEWATGCTGCGVEIGRARFHAPEVKLFMLVPVPVAETST